MSDTLADRLDGWVGELSNSTDWPTKKRLELVEDLIPAAAQLRAMEKEVERLKRANEGWHRRVQGIAPPEDQG